MLASFHNGPALGQWSRRMKIGHEKEYADALKDPEFAKLCNEMGLTVEDAIRFHKLMQG
jgi:hypothetical protein